MATPSYNIATDPAVADLLQSDKALHRLLERNKIQQQREFEIFRGKRQRVEKLVMDPEHQLRVSFDMVLLILLVYTCIIVPLRIAFPVMFDGSTKAGWDSVDILIEW